MIGFIDEHQDRYGIEPLCGVLSIVPSTYYAHHAQRRDPQRRSQRAKRDAALTLEIERAWGANFKVYGARKVWLQLNREAIPVARCTVARLMKAMGIQGVRRGRRTVTTLPDEAMERPRDAVNRHFKARRPNALCALAETVIGLFKTEVIRQQGPWKNVEEVEFATLTWVDWFNNRRLLKPIGDRPPAEKENEYYRQLGESARAARLKLNSLR